MRHTTPAAALATLDRELEALCADASVAGSMLERRLESVLELLPVVGEAARRDPAPAQRDEVLRQLESMHARCESLTAILRTRLSEVSAELTTLRTGQEAAESYASPSRAPTLRYQFNRIG